MRKTLPVLCLILSTARAQPAAAERAGWPDPAPLTKSSTVIALENGTFVRVDVLGERLFRVRQAPTTNWTESALNRYGILATNLPPAACRVPPRRDRRRPHGHHRTGRLVGVT